MLNKRVTIEKNNVRVCLMNFPYCLYHTQTHTYIVHIHTHEHTHMNAHRTPETSNSNSWAFKLYCSSL